MVEFIMPVAGIDIFAGAGGLSEGFIQAGFHIIGTVEKDRWACETQRMRHIFYNLKKLKNWTNTGLTAGKLHRQN